MAVDCTNTVEVRQKVCANATDIEEMITNEDGVLTTNYGAKPFKQLVRENVQNDLQALGIDYVISYVWADATARLAETGMILNEQGLQQDTNEIYTFNGTSWIAETLTETEQAYIIDTREVYRYVSSVWSLYYTVGLENAQQTPYDNTDSGLYATNVKLGIDENSRKDKSVIYNITVDADYTLTDLQNQYGRIEITDTGVLLTTGRNIIVDNNEHTFLFVNSTAQTLTVKTSAGTGVDVLSGEVKVLRNDSVNVIEYEGQQSFSILGTLNISNLLHIEDQKPSGTAGGAGVVGANTRDLNTVTVNTISGASLLSNQITLPAGSYIIEASAPAYEAQRNRLYFYNVSDSTEDIIGESAYQSANGIQTRATIKNKAPLTIASSKTFELRHEIGALSTTNTLGFPMTDGRVNIYAEITIWKVG